MGSNYYEDENYYSGESSREKSRWFGKGAEQLGLNGQVSPEVFNDLLHGKLPNGEVFRKARKVEVGGKKYRVRSGLDLTFSAPKSVTLLALVKGEERLLDAHEQAVERTLEIVQRSFAHTRLRLEGGKQVAVKSPNLVVGQFHHDTSRDLDPHLHTHCVLLNMTWVEGKQKWYSLHNDRIFKNKKLLGQIYQNELAGIVKGLGYAIEAREHGQFEIAGFEREHLEAFSKRRMAMLRKLQVESTWADREGVWDATRVKKGDPIPRVELQNVWQHEAKSLGIEFPIPGRVVEQPEQRVELQNTVGDGIAHCEERDVAFRAEKVAEFVLAEVGRFAYADVEQAIADSDSLIHLDGRVTTQTAVQRELSTIRLMEEGRGQVEAIAGREEAEGYLEKIKGELALQGWSLTVGQQRAIAATVTSCDAVVGWQGVAGAGKTYALARVKEWFESSGVSVRGFAPSAEAAKVLGDDLGIEARTVDGLLLSDSKGESDQPQLWIVDEAGLLSAKNALKLLQRAKAEGARVLLVGDTRQLSAVEAGNPFKSLQQAGMFTVQLDRSIRQQGVADLDRAVTLFSKGEVVASIEHLQQYDRIAVIPKAAERRSQLVADYLSLTPAQREETLILTGTHRERYEIVEGIRAGLKAEGLLGRNHTVERLERRNLTEVQQRYVHHFEVGDVVVPLRQQKRRGLEKGLPYEVVGKEDDRLLLQGADGEIRRVDAGFRKGGYRKQSMEIAPGEMLRWTKNDSQLGRRNGQQFWVESMEGAIARVQYVDGRFEEVDFSVPQPVDYAWVSTTYSSQGKTAKRVLVAADASVDKESFYVAISRVKDDLRIYTRDLDELVRLAQTSRANENPIELLRQQIRTEITQEVSSIHQQAPVPSHRGTSKRSTATQELDRMDSAGLETQPHLETLTMNRPPQPTRTPANEKTTAVQSAPKPVRRGPSRLIQMADKVRDLPLEKVVEFLEMEPDPQDQHKWRSDGAIVSINGSKFFDHLQQTGGGGAIDLVMHVRRTSFRNAAIWLTDQVSASAEASLQAPQRRVAPPILRRAFVPPRPDLNRWPQVREYLVRERGLPGALVDRLHEKEDVYAVGLSEAAKEKVNGTGKDWAEAIANAVFLRRDLQGNVVGAALRGASRGSQYKGLAAGTVRDRGWFQLDVGEGELQRVVLTESAIDAMSAAALARQADGVTRFIAIDGAGAVPVDWLRQQSKRGVEVWVGFDADGKGEQLAARVLEAFPRARRVKPTAGKDWNDMLTQHFQQLNSLQQWRIASEGIGEQVPAHYTLMVARNLRVRGIEELERTLAVLAHDPEYLRVAAKHGTERGDHLRQICF